MSESVNEESRLDRLEAKVAEIMKQLQVLNNDVTSLSVPCIASNRDFTTRMKESLENLQGSNILPQRLPL